MKIMKKDSTYGKPQHDVPETETLRNDPSGPISESKGECMKPSTNTVDTSHDDGTRQDGVPCGFHWGYSYNCDLCQHSPAPVPGDIEDYRNYYPDPDKQPWSAEDIAKLERYQAARKLHPQQFDDEGFPIKDKVDEILDEKH